MRARVPGTGPVAVRLPEIVDQARATTMRPEHQAWMVAGSGFTNPIGKAAHFAARHLNPNGLADADDPIHLIEMSVATRDTTIGDAVKGMNSWVLREGDPIKLFSLDENMRSKTIQNADGEGAHFFEIAAHRGRFQPVRVDAQGSARPAQQF